MFSTWSGAIGGDGVVLFDDSVAVRSTGEPSPSAMFARFHGRPRYPSSLPRWRRRYRERCVLEGGFGGIDLLEVSQ